MCRRHIRTTEARGAGEKSTFCFSRGIATMSTIHDHFSVGRRTSADLSKAALSGRLASFGRAALWPLRVLKARRELEMLAGMSELELKDIGLTRSDVRDVSALPSSQSPTRFLAARVEERHQARHHA
jgi:uncharacterized protein YjiS (DUF1127 family)